MQTDAATAAEADHARVSDTSSDSDSQPHPEDEEIPWWVAILKGAVPDSFLENFPSTTHQRMQRPVKVVSGCTGCSAEACAFKAGSNCSKGGGGGGLGIFVLSCNCTLFCTDLDSVYSRF